MQHAAQHTHVTRLTNGYGHGNVNVYVDEDEEVDVGSAITGGTAQTRSQFHLLMVPVGKCPWEM